LETAALDDSARPGVVLSSAVIDDLKGEGLSLAMIESLKDQGLSQSDVARIFGKSRQAVSKYLLAHGGRRTARQQALDHFPWQVQQRFTTASPYRRLRDHAEYMVTGGTGMTADELGRLRWFYRRLHADDVVVEYDPAIPASPGEVATGGFAYVARQPTDGPLIIRVNEHTLLTENGRDIWTFPAVEP
jgi:hypothetical protein